MISKQRIVINKLLPLCKAYQALRRLMEAVTSLGLIHYSAYTAAKAM